jgi:hypothetical protein
MLISELDLLVPQMMKLFLVTMSGLMQSMVIGLTMKNTPSGVANNIGSRTPYRRLRLLRIHQLNYYH